VVPVITTNAQSYELPEGRITRSNTEQAGVRSNGESLKDWILRHEIPEMYDMHVAYREIARRLYRLPQTDLPIPTEREEDLYAFDALPSPEALAEAQGVARGSDASQPATDFWPEGESVEDFIAAAMEGRYEEEDEPDS
jgi:hypothetical protein